MISRYADKVPGFMIPRNCPGGRRSGTCRRDWHRVCDLGKKKQHEREDRASSSNTARRPCMMAMPIYRRLRGCDGLEHGWISAHVDFIAAIVGPRISSRISCPQAGEQSISSRTGECIRTWYTCKCACSIHAGSQERAACMYLQASHKY
eukprot:3650863-Pleurochrysis_carterae.AAC.4